MSYTLESLDDDYIDKDEEYYDEYEDSEDDYKDPDEDYDDIIVEDVKDNKSTSDLGFSGGSEGAGSSALDVIDSCLDMIKFLQDKLNKSHEDMGHLLFEDYMVNRYKGVTNDDTLLGVKSLSSALQSYMFKVTPFMYKLISSEVVKPGEAENFKNAFCYCVLFVAWDYITKLVESKKLNSKDLKGYCSYLSEGYGYNYSLDAYANKLPQDLFKTADVDLIASVYTMSVVLSAIEDGTIKGVGKEKSVEEVKEEVQKPVREPKEYDGLIEDTLVDLITIYNSLYEDCFSFAPMGILTAAGIYVITRDNKMTVDIKTALYAKSLYNIVQDRMGLGTNVFSGVIPDNATDFLTHAYYPLFHLLNVNGLLSDGTKFNEWGKFRDNLKIWLRDLLYKLFDSYKGDMIKFKVEVTKRLTDVIIVNSFSATGVIELTYHRSLSGGKPIFKDIAVPKMHEVTGKSTGKFLSEPYMDYDVFKFMYVSDAKAYNGEILFAYKVYSQIITANQKISSDNIIIGKKLKDGLPYSINLRSPQQIFTTIVAGSGSGKGVLTLSILAGLYAAGHPVAYIDYKPDMAATLWNLERAMGGSCKFLATDSAVGVHKDGTRPVRDVEFGVHANTLNKIPTLSKSFRIIPYLKSMQLACAIASIRSGGAAGRIPYKQKIFFILDEAQSSNKVYEPFIQTLEEYLKDKEAPDDVKEVAKKTLRIFDKDLSRGIQYLGNTSGRQGEVGLILIGQQADPAAWKSGKGDWRYSLFGYPVSKTSLKLMGKGIGVGTKYERPDKLEGDEFKDDLGYWAVSKSASSGKDRNAVMIKSYMVLNDNDYPKEGGFAQKLLVNVTDSAVRENLIRNDLTTGDGVTVRKEAGFLGLMEMLSGGNLNSLADTFGSMYKIAEQVLTESGILESLGYTTVEEYLYSADENSFFTIDEIVDSFINKSMSTGKVHTKEELLAKHKAEREGLEKTIEEAKASGNYDEDYFNELLDDMEYSQQQELAELEELESSKGSGVPNMGQSAEISGNGIPNVTNTTSDSNNLGNKSTFPPPAGGNRIANAQGQSQSNNTTVGSAFGDTQQSNQNNFSDGTVSAQQSSNQDPLNNTESTPPNNRSGYSDTYTEPIIVDENPFDDYTGGTFNSAYAFKRISRLILSEIQHAYVGYDRIYTFDIANSGLLVINGVQFKPKFDDNFIDSLPIDIQSAVSKGNIAELFYFEDLYKFRNLQRLSIESTQLAETRIRLEMGLKRKKGWGTLFKKFRNLRELYIAGNLISSAQDANDYESSGRAGYDLKEKLSSAWSLSDLSDSWVGGIWNATPGFLKKGLGFTLGVKGVMLATTLFGPWGLLFGALTAGFAISDMRNKQLTNQANRTTRSNTSTTSNRGSSSNKTNGSNANRNGSNSRSNPNNIWD